MVCRETIALNAIEEMRKIIDKRTPQRDTSARAFIGNLNVGWTWSS